MRLHCPEPLIILTFSHSAKSSIIFIIIGKKKYILDLVKKYHKKERGNNLPHSLRTYKYLSDKSSFTYFTPVDNIEARFFNVSIHIFQGHDHDPFSESSRTL